MSKLFNSISLRKLQLANRVVVSPMCQYSAIDGNAQPWHWVHLGQLAMSSAGMLMLEATAIEDIGRITPSCLGLYSNENATALEKTLKVIRGLNQDCHVPVCIQIAHAGRKGSSHEPWHGGQQIALNQGGWQAVAPSAIPHLAEEHPPRALSISDMDALKTKFVEAVKTADRLGLDAVEAHAAHGYLLHQFLSPLSNQRTDQYGGSLHNRMRYPLEIFSAMRAAWPDDKPMGIRISASDWDKASSWDIEEACTFSRQCEEIGADWIDVSSGGVSSNQKIVLGPGYQLHFAEAIKQAVNVPVMAVGLITEPDQAEKIISEDQADMVALARAFLYNPRWVWHAAATLGATVTAPRQYWRSEPHDLRGLYGETETGAR